ncbi:VOC family protein [Paraburkholderia dipogonis]|uniref:VOC family protein n=1 Tax=Paraburkholderia dipogonis TaxID=1211383 RepID=UPI0035E5A34F
MLPPVDLRPPFNITRTSHVVLHVADLAKSREFYVNVIGLIVSDEDDQTCYLRGLAEACHHSLVLVQTNGEATCKRLGFRVFFEEDLDLAYQFFSGLKDCLQSGSMSRIRAGRSMCLILSARRSNCARRWKTRERQYLNREIFQGRSRPAARSRTDIRPPTPTHSARSTAGWASGIPSIWHMETSC